MTPVADRERIVHSLGLSQQGLRRNATEPESPTSAPPYAVAHAIPSDIPEHWPTRPLLGLFIREEGPTVRAHCGVTQFPAIKSAGTVATAESTDAAAIRRSLAHPAAFADVFDRHFVAVHRYVHRRAGRDIADELTGETFRVAFQARVHWSRMTPDARPWLLGIATNLLRRHRRTEERRLRALAAALAALSPDDRDVLLLIALGDLAYDDAAEALGIPPGTVASRLNRARRVLTATLARPEEDQRG